MSHLQVIARLEEMLRMALDIIEVQARLLAMHGIETKDGSLEAAREQLRDDAKEWT